MNSNARWKHLYTLWSRAMESDELPQFDRWISDEFRQNTKFGSKDRKWYSEFLFLGIRFCTFALFCESFDPRRSLIENIDNQRSLSKKDLLSKIKTISPEHLFMWISLRIGHETDDFLAHKDANFYKHSPAVFTKVTALLKANKDIDSQLILSGTPLWYKDLFAERLKVSQWTETEQAIFFERQNVRPPLWVRINHPPKKEAVLKNLSDEGFEYFENKEALAVSGKKGIFTIESYRTGQIEIQDLASQMIGACVDAKGKELVWDSCAGGGGKTLQIASKLQNKGVIYASDIRAYKLDEVKKRARRAGFFNIRCIPWEGKELPQFQKEVQNNKGFDWVLVDAPCSSSGTWRRNPDAKFRFQKSEAENLFELQLQLLEGASEAVSARGKLVYTTCSWIVDENEKIAENFLASHPHFELEYTKMFGNPNEDADTMFAAVFKRK